MNRKSESVETLEPMAAQPGPHPLRAYLGMIAATVFWASNAVAVKLIVRELPHPTAAGVRVVLAALTLAILYGARGGRFRLRRGEARQFLMLSLWGLALSFLFFTAGLYYTSVSHAVLVGALVPVAVLLLARMDGQERISYGKLGGLLISLLGVFLLALDRAPGPGPSWKGDLMVVAGVWFVPWLSITLPRLPWSEITWVGWSSLLYSATVGSAGAYLAYYYSLRQMKASEVAVFHYLQPVLAILLGIWFFQESLTPRFEVAAALILAGVFLAERQ